MEIDVGQVWRRRADGLEVTVTECNHGGSIFIDYRGARRGTTLKSLRKHYERVS